MRITDYDMRAERVCGRLMDKQEQGRRLDNISGCEFTADWHCLYAVHVD